MKIVISNTVALNVGDAAILQGIIKILHLTFGQEIEIIIYDSKPEIASRYYPMLTFRKSLYIYLKQISRVRYLPNKYLKARIKLFYFATWCVVNKLSFLPKIFLSNDEYASLEEYSSADLIISTGGTYLVENYPLEGRIFDYNVSLLLKRPLVFFTQSLGPFSNSSYRRDLKEIFEKSILILLRDQQSKSNIKDLKVETANFHVISDAAFALAEIDTLQNNRRLKAETSPLKIAISVREWKHFRTVDSLTGLLQYKEALIQAIEYLVNKHGAQVTFISTCQGIPEYWTDDSKLASDIFKELPITIQKSVEVNSSFHSPKKLSAILKSYDLVIATRLHMAILALGVGIPVLAIAYEFKTLELFKRLNQEKCALDIESLNSELLVNSLDMCLSSLSQIRESFSHGVEQEIKSAVSSQDLLSQVYKHWQKEGKYLNV